ncbi:Erf-like ssDNA annealing protein [Vibrio phage Vc1]|uniref:Erf-like ssDNA annealing protein n=1 Tax=Vibrio phage Vc1 TaxID=1480731 RepID=A0A9X9SEC9_9CAUD|nr:Erf-like ssDNA annealing protein [Vibrio virus 2019VC1]
MRLSESKTNVIKTLFEARQLFTKVKNGKENTHLKNSYATLDSVLDAIMPALTDLDIFLTQDQFMSDDLKSMTVLTRFIHVESNEWVEYSFTLPTQKLDPQGGGSTNSYARRYALCTCLGLATADDDAQLAVKTAQDWKKDLDQCVDITDLQETFKTAFRQSDAANRVIIKEHYDKLKAKMTAATATGFTPAKPTENLAKSEVVANTHKPEVKSQSIESFE